jgi:hypothetical protein
MRTGYRLAVGVGVITVIVAVVLFVAELAGSSRDADAYGQVPVPGRESVNLPAGEVIIFYGERGPGSGDAALTVPRNLQLRVRTASGQLLLGSTPYVFAQFDDGDYVRKAIAKLRVPEAGDYEAVSPTTAAGASGPVISFGHEGSKDYGYVLFVLAGGGLLAAVLGIGTAIVARTER